MTALGIYVAFGIPTILFALAFGALYLTNRSAREYDRKHPLL